MSNYALQICELGKTLRAIANDELRIEDYELSPNERRQLSSLAEALSIENVDLFLKKYDYNPRSDIKARNIAIVMAGNLPLVGFMDIVYVLLSGNIPVCKLSSKDDKLLPEIITMANLSNVVVVDEIPTNIDAIIVTGSDNTARYFDYHYKSLPCVIRKNRTSLAILRGDESQQDLELLADDILSYSGRGCRNVSKLLLPPNYDFNQLINAIAKYSNPLVDENYADNYRYNVALFKTTGRTYLDAGVVILYEDEQLGTPIATINYHYYDTLQQATQYITENSDKTQCVVGSSPNTIPFGQAQIPMLTDYADNIDIIQWIKREFCKALE